MKLLSEDLLMEYGFTENFLKSNRHIKVVTRDGFEVTIRRDGIYYSNLGIDYPLRDTAALRKLYKENLKKDLNQ